MENAAIAKLLSEIADLMEIRGENAFKIRAHQRAARTVENLSEPIKAIAERGELEQIDGIGKKIAEKIQEALESGKMTEHQELLADLPDGFLNLLNVPNLGPKKTKLVYETLGITSVDMLKQAAEKEELQKLPGMGKKSEEKILKGIQNMNLSQGRFNLGMASVTAHTIVSRLKEIKGVKKIEVAGSYRRGKETVGDLDILVSAQNSKQVMNTFVNTENVREVIAHGEKKSSIVLHSGLQVDLRVVEQASFGAALMYFTGSKEHNVQLRERAIKKGMKINEYGLYESKSNKKLAGKTEEEIYKKLNLAFIIPELREGFDEIELAAKQQLPDLISIEDIQSSLHNHTKWSDGRMTIDELADESIKRGYRFIAITDHSGSLGVANGLNEERLKRQIEAIHEFNERRHDIKILCGSEVDIRANGALDFSDKMLEQLDIVIAAIHSSFEQPRDKMTDRICNAIKNPHVDILAHPTGRMLGRRPALDFDTETLFATSAESGTVLEINSHFYRLDLNDKHIKEAKQYDVRFSIDTDTHAADDYNHLELGIKTARRGRLKAEDVMNTLDYQALIDSLA